MKLKRWLDEIEWMIEPAKYITTGMIIGILLMAIITAYIAPAPAPEVKELETTEVLEIAPIEIEKVAEKRPQKIIKDNPLDAEYQNWLWDLCEEQGYDFWIINAIQWVESRWQVDAYNADTDCIGLMQIMGCYHTWYDTAGNPLDMFEPYRNTLEGIETLKEYMQKCGGLENGLIAYSGGDSEYADIIIEKAEELKNDYYAASN